MKYPIYLDNNATTPVDARVVDAMLPVLTEHFGNPSSQTHAYGWFAEELVNVARENIASLIKCDAEEIVFTSGATESINLAICGAADARSKQNIISFKTEHKATLDTLESLGGIETRLLDVESTGHISTDAVLNEIDEHSSVLSICLANNEIGVIHQVSEITHAAKKRNPEIVVHIDGSQALGKIEVNVRKLGADLFSFSGHKVYGPKGIGGLFIKSGVKLTPLLYGGGHEGGYRAGTLNVPGIVGIGAAAKICGSEMNNDRQRVIELSSKLYSNLKSSLEGVFLNGPEENRLPGNLSLRFEGVQNAALIGEIQSKLAISTSSACTSASKTPSHVLAALGIPRRAQEESVRIGIGRFNTEKEIDNASTYLVEAVKKIRKS